MRVRDDVAQALSCQSRDSYWMVKGKSACFVGAFSSFKAVSEVQQNLRPRAFPVPALDPDTV